MASEDGSGGVSNLVHTFYLARYFQRLLRFFNLKSNRFILALLKRGLLSTKLQKRKNVSYLDNIFFAENDTTRRACFPLIFYRIPSSLIFFIYSSLQQGARVAQRVM